MKFVSIDIETTGLDRDKCQAIELGAYIEDTSNLRSRAYLPKFECIIEWPEYSGSAYAINMNARIFQKLAGAERLKDKYQYRKDNGIVPHYEVAGKFNTFLADNGLGIAGKYIVINAAGKNFARFDWEFLTRLPHWSTFIGFSNRVIDPAILLADWENDTRLPDSNTCIRRAL